MSKKEQKIGLFGLEKIMNDKERKVYFFLEEILVALPFAQAIITKSVSDNAKQMYVTIQIIKYDLLKKPISIADRIIVDWDESPFALQALPSAQDAFPKRRGKMRGVLDVAKERNQQGLSFTYSSDFSRTDSGFGAYGAGKHSNFSGIRVTISF